MTAPLFVLHLDADDVEPCVTTLLAVEHGTQVSISLRELKTLVNTSHPEEILHEMLSDLTDRTDPPPDTLTREGVDLWFRRNWIPSICHHSVAARFEGADSSDHSMQIRKSVISRYETNGPLPARYTSLSRKILLPQPIKEDDEFLIDSMERRRTIRAFRTFDISPQLISNVLWNGLKLVRDTRRAATNHPMGILHSFGVGCEIFCVIHSATGVAEGAYHYDVEDHSLALVRSAVSRKWIWKVLNYQRAPLTAAITIFLVLDFAQAQWRYRHERALTNQFMDIGRVAQRIILSGEHLDLGSFMSPALMDSSVRRIFRLNLERYYPVHAICLGQNPRRTK